MSSDGTIFKPYCTWASVCTWDVEAQTECAMKMCEAAGYTFHNYISTTGNICTDNFISGIFFYWLVDRDEYYYGEANLDAGVTVDCIVPTTTSTTTTITQTTSTASTATTTTSTVTTVTATLTTTTLSTTTTTTRTTTTTTTTVSTSTTTTGSTTTSTTTTSTTTTSTTTTSTTTTSTTTTSSTTMSSTTTSSTTTSSTTASSTTSTTRTTSTSTSSSTTLTSTTTTTTTTTSTTVTVSTSTTSATTTTTSTTKTSTGTSTTSSTSTTTTATVTRSSTTSSTSTTTTATVTRSSTTSTSTSSTTSTTTTTTNTVSATTSTTTSTLTATTTTTTTTSSTITTVTLTTTATTVSTTETDTTTRTTTRTSTRSTTTTSTLTATTTTTFTLGPTTTTTTTQTHTSTTTTGTTTTTKTLTTTTITATTTTATTSTATTATTTTATTTTSTTTTLKTSCYSLPLVSHALNLASCAGMPNGTSCELQCAQGYFAVGRPKCILAAWTHDGACLPTGATARRVRAAKAAVRLGATNPADVSVGWSLNLHESIVRAVGVSVGLPSYDVHVETVAATTAGRLLLDSGALDGEADVWLGDGELAEPRNLQAATTTTAPQDSSPAQLLLTLVLDTSASPNETSSELMSRLLGTYGHPGLAAALADELRQQSQAVPQGLHVSAVSQAVVIERLMMPVVEWLVRDWGECNEQCGEGLESRAVVCAMGSEAACGNAGSGAGSRPSSDQVCEAYTNCPFNIICPLGPGTMPCAIQAVVVILVMLIPACCLGLCAYVALYWICKAPKRGRMRLRDKDLRHIDADFRIIRPPARSSARKSTAATLLSRLNSVDSQVAKDGKTHVVWDIDFDKVEEHLQRTRRPSSSAELAVGEERTMGPEASAMGHAQSSSSAWRRRDILARNHDEPSKHSFPAYEEGARIEYWSRGNRCWVIGEINLAFPAGVSGLARYDVRAGKAGQTRRDVGLAAVRMPLERDELVEIYSKGGGGRWVQATVHGPQSHFATTAGYNILVKGAENPIRGVPASRLRRLYLPHDRVEVYRGAVMGWSAAVVQPLALTPAAVPTSSGAATAHVPCPLAPPHPEPKAATPGTPVGKRPSRLKRLLRSLRRAVSRRSLEALAEKGQDENELGLPPEAFGLPERVVVDVPSNDRGLTPPSASPMSAWSHGVSIRSGAPSPMAASSTNEDSSSSSDGERAPSPASPRQRKKRLPTADSELNASPAEETRGAAPEGMEPWAWLLALPDDPLSPSLSVGVTRTASSGERYIQAEWFPTFLVRRAPASPLDVELLP